MNFLTTADHIERMRNNRIKRLEEYRISMLSALKASTSVVIVRIRESKFLSPVKEQEIQVDLLYGIQ